jgi:hypothetical protein
MIGHEMAAAFLAPLAKTPRRLVEGANVFRTLRNLDGLGLPQRKSVDRTCRPMAARLAMAIAHRGRLAGDRELH